MYVISGERSRAKNREKRSGKRRQTSGGKGREESQEKKKFEENIDGTNWAP